MNKLLALGASVLLGITAWAGAPKLLINGEPVEKTLSYLTFDGDNVIVHFGDESAEYDMETVEITFPTTIIDKVEMHNLNVEVGDVITVTGVETNEYIDVYNAAGHLCSRTKADADETVIDLNDCPAGIYLLKAGHNCIKFVKR